MFRRPTVVILTLLLLNPVGGAGIAAPQAQPGVAGTSLKAIIEDYTPPAKLDSETLRTRIKILASALQSGIVKGDARSCQHHEAVHSRIQVVASRRHPDPRRGQLLAVSSSSRVASQVRWKSMTGVGSPSRANSRRETHARARETIAC